MITSQFRIDFWLGKIFLLVGKFALSGFLLFLSHRNGVFDYQHFWFWMSVLTFLWVSVKAYRFLFHELKSVTVSEKGIHIRHLMGEAEHVSFNEIRKMELLPVHQVRGSTRRSFVSHYELEITLHNGSTIYFDGYQYKNFGAVKSMIYQYVYH